MRELHTEAGRGRYRMRMNATLRALHEAAQWMAIMGFDDRRAQIIDMYNDLQAEMKTELDQFDMFANQ